MRTPGTNSKNVNLGSKSEFSSEILSIFGAEMSRRRARAKPQNFFLSNTIDILTIHNIIIALPIELCITHPFCSARHFFGPKRPFLRPKSEFFNYFLNYKSQNLQNGIN